MRGPRTPPPPARAASAADVVGASRALAATLRTGQHRLDDRAIRRIYGVGALTPASRAAIGAELERAGFALVGDPRRAPVVVRQDDPAAADGLQLASGRPRTGRTVAGALVVVVLAAVGGVALDGGSTDGVPPSRAAAPAQRAVVPLARRPEFLRAARLAQDDDYAAASAAARPLGAAAVERIERKSARRLAARARTALEQGSRPRARRLLREADELPEEPAVRSARAALRRSEARASARRAAAREQAAAEEAEAAAAAAAAVPVAPATGTVVPPAPTETVPEAEVSP